MEAEDSFARVHKITPLDPILSQMDLVHILLLLTFILDLTLSSSLELFRLKYFTYFSSLPCPTHLNLLCLITLTVFGEHRSKYFKIVTSPDALQ